MRHASRPGKGFQPHLIDSPRPHSWALYVGTSMLFPGMVSVLSEKGKRDMTLRVGDFSCVVPRDYTTSDLQVIWARAREANPTESGVQ